MTGAGPAYWRPWWRSLTTEDAAVCSGRSTYKKPDVDVLVSEVTAMLHLGQDDTLLDIGCAAGLIGEPLSEVCRYVGIDYAPGAVERFCRRSGRSVRVCCADATALPFRDRAFTKTLMAGVLQFLTPEDTEAAVSEMRRVTADDGIGLIACVVVVRVPEKDVAIASWLAEDLEALARRCGWASCQWRNVNPKLSPSVYHRDLLLRAA